MTLRAFVFYKIQQAIWSSPLSLDKNLGKLSISLFKAACQKSEVTTEVGSL